jgi:H/ACA ribonucleoprotein complex subunit 2
VKEVVKGIRKGEKGCAVYALCTPNANRIHFSLLILAADITPIDIIAHLPVLSEEAQIPYVFVPSKEELGQASATKRPTSCVMVCPDAKAKPAKKKEGAVAEEEDDGKDGDFRELFDECCKEVNKLDSAILV